MKQLFLIIGIAFVVACLPALMNFFRARRRFSGGMSVTCPETDQAATIRLDAFRAAATSLTGSPGLRVKSCSRWSGPAGQCQEQCIGENDALLLDRSMPA